MKILISAAGSAAVVTIIQHLKSKGYYVIGFDANQYSAPLGEEICNEFHLAPLCASKEFIPFINELAAHVDIYIPFIDEEIVQLTSNPNISRQTIEKAIISTSESTLTCLSKIKFQHFCQLNNLPVAPITTVAPAIFKPEYGRGSKGVFEIKDNELIPYFSKQQGVIQELISGVEYTVDVLTDKNHQWLFGVARKRVETAGVSRIGEIEQSPEVIELAKLCCKAFKFSGPINIQIMLDAHNKAHLIEINPRLSGSLMFTTKAGFDIIDTAIKLWLNREYILPEPSSIKPYRFVRYWQEFIC